MVACSNIFGELS